MKILVFSDTHLSDTFDEGKYNYLFEIISQADRIVINGDFWDRHNTTFTKFLQSPWNKLFPLLKKRHAVYLYGNHDRKEFSDKRAGRFSDIQTDRYELTSGGKTFVFIHGDKLVPIFGNRFEDESYHGVLFHVLHRLQKQIVQRGLSKVLFQRYNRKIKHRIPHIIPQNHILVCGHTHCAELNLQKQFINTGINHFGVGQYIFIEDGVITPGEYRYT